MRATEQAHQAVRRVVRTGETVVDATMGNGHDTLFLVKLVGAKGNVIRIDLQEEAVELTRHLLLENGIGDGRVQLVRGSHAELASAISGPVAAVMFNLGYLPSGDHAFTTRKETTIAALEQGWRALRGGGVITAVCYRGHPGGREEAEAISAWAAALVGAEIEISERKEREDGPLLVTVRKSATAGGLKGS